MRFQSTLSILFAAQCLLTASPAFADGDSKWSKVVAIPKVAAGVTYGVGLGVPIRMVKYVKSESHRMTKTLLDDFDGPGFWNLAMARSIGYPYGVASGTVLGLIRGVQYGGEYGVEEPFSKKSIGIGEPCIVGEK
jgi:hypothetical protein